MGLWVRKAVTMAGSLISAALVALDCLGLNSPASEPAKKKERLVRAALCRSPARGTLPGEEYQWDMTAGPLIHIFKRSNRKPRQRELTGPNLAPDWVPTLSAGG